MNKKILLVEDEPFIKEMYEQILRERDYEVTSVTDGQEAIAILFQQQSNFDLVLLDIMLPSLDGFNILKKIKDANSTINELPVILLTNLANDQIIQEAIKIGAYKYLIKGSLLPDQVADEIDSFFKLDQVR